MTTELMTPNSLSKGLTAKLKKAGTGVDEKTLVKAADQVEKSRADYQTKSLCFGVLCLARKLSLKHGKWLPERAKYAAAAHLSERSIMVYMQLAKQFLSKLEQGDFNEEFEERKIQGFKIEQFESLAILHPAHGLTAQLQIKEFIGGRTIQQMLTDLREADKAAEAEYFDEIREKQAVGNEAAGAGQKAPQYDFFELLNSDIVSAISSVEHVFAQPYWLDESIPSADKITALQQIRAKMKDLTQQLSDKEKAIKEGAGIK